MRSVVIALLWRALALICIALGTIGLFLPGLPTVPFLLVAAWAAGKGWPRLESWLLTHARWGASIRAWREQGAVPRRAKWAATFAMILSAALMALSGAPAWMTLCAAALMLAVAVWLWMRPER